MAVTIVFAFVLARIIGAATEYALAWAFRNRDRRKLDQIAYQVGERTGLQITIRAHHTRFTAEIVIPRTMGATVAMMDPLPAADVKSWLLGIDAGWRLRPPTPQQPKDPNK